MQTVDETKLEIISNIQTETTKLEALASEVKVMREISSRSELRAREAQCDLGAELEALISELRKDDELNRLKITIEFIKSPTPVIVRLSSTDCFRIFSNLIRNAAQASPRNSVITVEILHVDERPIVEVRDQEHGMSPDVMRHIFDMNYTTKADTGTGLGLPIVRSACDLHGIQIDVSSQPGIGTIFKLCFAKALVRASRLESYLEVPLEK